MNDKPSPSRDFIGYADQPPTVVWPGEARPLGRPGRIGSLHKFLDYLQKHQKVWICRHDDLAKYWAEHYPNPALGKGSTP